MRKHFLRIGRNSPILQFWRIYNQLLLTISLTILALLNGLHLTTPRSPLPSVLIMMEGGLRTIGMPGLAINLGSSSGSGFGLQILTLLLQD